MTRETLTFEIEGLGHVWITPSDALTAVARWYFDHPKSGKPWEARVKLYRYYEDRQFAAMWFEAAKKDGDGAFRSYDALRPYGNRWKEVVVRVWNVRVKADPSILWRAERLALTYQVSEAERRIESAKGRIGKENEAIADLTAKIAELEARIEEAAAAPTPDGDGRDITSPTLRRLLDGAASAIAADFAKDAKL